MWRVGLRSDGMYIHRMGWLFGAALRDGDPRTFETLAGIHDPARHVVRAAAVYAACGGPETNCHSSSADSESETAGGGWVVAGNAFDVSSGRARAFTGKDWRRIFAGGLSAFRNLDGDFVAARCGDDGFELYTDPLGSRLLFVAALPFGVAFSTRIDWLARLAGGFEIDAEALGPLLLGNGVYASVSGLRGVRRAGPGARVTGDARSFDVAASPWTPDFSDVAAGSYRDKVAAFMRPEFGHGSSVSVGLSGGIDSRLMLALTSRSDNVFAHVFGYAGEPDVDVAKQVAAARDVELSVYPHEQRPDPRLSFEFIREAVALTHGMAAASTLLEKRRYADVAGGGGPSRRALLVGMFGELARRQFYVAYVMRGGARRLARGDTSVLLSHLTSTPPPFFAGAVAARMRDDALMALRLVLESMPGARDIRIENFLDLLAVRTQLPAGYAAHQNLLGQVAAGYSPFAQQSVLRAAFGLALRERRNSRAALNIIKDEFPEAALLPLVANDARYRFGVSTAVAQLGTRIRRAQGSSHYTRARHDVLVHVEAFVRDIAASREARDCDLYDMGLVTEALARFYGAAAESQPGRPAGKTIRSLAGDAALIDSWLTFELWRRAAGGL